MQAYLEPINKSWCLEQLCETNYQKLLRLIPALFIIKSNAIGVAQSKSNLALEIIERGPYTLTIELKHCIGQRQTYNSFTSAVKIRIYQDVKIAEVLRHAARPEVAVAIKDLSQSRAIMDYKWRLNYFLTQWLDYCLQADYQFHDQAQTHVTHAEPL